MLSFAFQTQRADFIDNPVEPAAPETKTETRDRPERGQASRPETKTETLSNPRGGALRPTRHKAQDPFEPAGRASSQNPTNQEALRNQRQ